MSYILVHGMEFSGNVIIWVVSWRWRAPFFLIKILDWKSLSRSGKGLNLAIIVVCCFLLVKSDSATGIPDSSCFDSFMPGCSSVVALEKILEAKALLCNRQRCSRGHRADMCKS